MVRERIKVLRSKNAGPFVLTFDIILRSRADFELVHAALTPERIAETFHVSTDKVVPVGAVEDLFALKFSVARAKPCGHPGDSDCYGMNQEEPLARLVDEVLQMTAQAQ